MGSREGPVAGRHHHQEQQAGRLPDRQRRSDPLRNLHLCLCLCLRNEDRPAIGFHPEPRAPIALFTVGTLGLDENRTESLRLGADARIVARELDGESVLRSGDAAEPTVEGEEGWVPRLLRPGRGW